MGLLTTMQDLVDHLGRPALKAFIFEREVKIKLHSSDLKKSTELNTMNLKRCVAAL